MNISDNFAENNSPMDSRDIHTIQNFILNYPFMHDNIYYAYDNNALTIYRIEDCPVKQILSILNQNIQDKIYQIFVDQGFFNPNNWIHIINYDDYYKKDIITKISLNNTTFENIMYHINQFADSDYFYQFDECEEI